MKKLKKPFRQGDVLLIPVRKGFADAKMAPRENGRVVLAHGEVTGHSHAVAEPEAAMQVLDDQAAMAAAARKLLASVGLTVEIRDEDVIGVLHTPNAASVSHEEHGTIPLAAGSHHVVLRQREYSPEAIRNVRD